MPGAEGIGRTFAALRERLAPAVASGTRRDLFEIAGLVLISRILLLLFGVVARTLFDPSGQAVSDPLGIWIQWDAKHYLTLASQGYQADGDPALIAFFPLLPTLIRAGSLILDPAVAGLLISAGATLAAALGLYRLVRLDAPAWRARASVVVMLAFPTAFAFVPPYSEPLFLALAVWAFVRAREDDWLGSGVLACLAGATRIQGALLVPALAVEYLARRGRPGRDLLGLAVGLLGPLGYLALNQAVYGDAFRFLMVQADLFSHSLAPPWEVLGGLVGAVTRGPLDATIMSVYAMPLVAFVLLGLVALWSLWALRSGLSRASYATYTVLSFVSLTSVTFPISLPRYILGVFPTFVALAGLASHRLTWRILVAVMLVLLSVFTTLFVLGRWAF